MKRLEHLAEDLARKGYGVAWHKTYETYWPLEADGESINWWHDPEDCDSPDFANAIRKTYNAVTEYLARKAREAKDKP